MELDKETVMSFRAHPASVYQANWTGAMKYLVETGVTQTYKEAHDTLMDLVEESFEGKMSVLYRGLNCHRGHFYGNNDIQIAFTVHTDVFLEDDEEEWADELMETTPIS